MAELSAKQHLSPGPLQEGQSYTVVRASFGRSDGFTGGTIDSGRAHVVLRDEQGNHFMIVPSSERLPGADGSLYSEALLDCLPISAT